MRGVGAVAGVMAMLAIAVAGCGGGGSATTSAAGPNAPACHGSDLVISVQGHSSIGSGGTIYTPLLITNRSTRPCTVAGVPKVVGLGHDGKVVGVGEPEPLLRVGSKGGHLRVRLDGGEAATFLVSHYDGIGAGRCHFTTTEGLRVTIPGTGSRQVVHPSMGYCPAPGSGLGLRVGRIEPISAIP